MAVHSQFVEFSTFLDIRAGLAVSDISANNELLVQRLYTLPDATPSIIPVPPRQMCLPCTRHTACKPASSNAARNVTPNAQLQPRKRTQASPATHQSLHQKHHLSEPALAHLDHVRNRHKQAVAVLAERHALRPAHFLHQLVAKVLLAELRGAVAHHIAIAV